jgi:hypothetical protein
MGEMAFDIERSIFLKSAPQPTHDRHVFVSGLARAGTTVLMRELHASGQFTSLTYEDMPFVLAPNTWNAISRRFSKKLGTQERAHGDGILVDANSPEALDEVFWRVFTGADYLKRDGLYPHSPDKETLERYGDYIRLILHRCNGSRYISKNNNNILRLPALLKTFPESVFLIPIRAPLSHAQSLLEQHRRFTASDPFTIKYMTWLCHHEFGATHRPFMLRTEINQFSDTATLNYWLERWVQCYSYLNGVLDGGKAAAFFVPYESLCTHPDVWTSIAELAGVNGSGHTEFRMRERSSSPACDPQISQTANDLYRNIVQSALKKLGVGA